MFSTNSHVIKDLRAKIKGRVIQPDDDGYDQARTIFPGGIDRRPVAIAKVADSSDVSQVIALAGESGLELAVRSGGHSVFGVVDAGIVLDLSDMRALNIDLERKTAWAETGLTAGEYTHEAGKHGLATGFGDTASVGIGGLTMGGGVGYLVRKYGLTIDDLLAAEIVTADGKLLNVDAENHPDLFWAIRGGGGNFGVATRFKYRLHELGTIVGGMLLLPASADVIASFMAEAEAAPEELSTIANVMPAPPMPFVPEEHHGQLIVMALMAFAGEVEPGERVVSRFRALAPPIVDMVRAIPYPEMYLPDQEGYHPIATNRNFFLDAVDHKTAEVIVNRLQTSTAPMRVIQLRALGGAMARVPVEATAFAHRGRRIMATVAAVYESPEEEPMHAPWVTGFASQLASGEDGAYVGFLGDEGGARVREAYPGSTWHRLTEVKRRYDPANLFHLNQNIPPAGR